MSSLFVKIFLWFWLAIIVITCVVFGESHYVRANQTLLDQTVMPIHAQQAAEMYEKDNAQEFEQYLQIRQKAIRGEWYFFDEKGREVRGKALSPEMLKLSRAAATDNQTHIFTTPTGRRLVGQSVKGLSGRRYVLTCDLNYHAFTDFLTAAPQLEALRLIAVLLCSTLGCFWLAHYITAPIRKLRAATNQPANGNLSARVGGRGMKRHDEIAQLGRDFNNMAQRIESLASSQKRLITDVSHELRSPLARLDIALGLARKNANVQIIKDLDRIERESERLNDLIGDLLRLYRIEGQAAVSTDKEPIALDELIYEIAADADYEARSRNCAVRVLRIEPCWILGIHELVRSAIENIIRNGINYTQQGTEVEITVQLHQRDSVVIHIQDHGHGVPAEHLEDIFHPFFRVQDARERSSGGAGLGLAITERIIHLHGGWVKAGNAPEGGLIVELSFPLLSQHSAVKHTNKRLIERADKHSVNEDAIAGGA